MLISLLSPRCPQEVVLVSLGLTHLFSNGERSGKISVSPTLAPEHSQRAGARKSPKDREAREGRLSQAGNFHRTGFLKSRVRGEKRESIQ